MADGREGRHCTGRLKKKKEGEEEGGGGGAGEEVARQALLSALGEEDDEEDVFLVLDADGSISADLFQHFNNDANDENQDLTQEEMLVEQNDDEKEVSVDV